jgi:hypothetical protein
MGAMTEAEGEEFRRVARLQYSEIERLRAALGQLQTENRRLIDWVMGEGPDALTELQRVYSNPKTTENNKIKAAGLALPYEKAKPAATVNNVYSLFDYLERDRLQKQEAAKVIEHQPAQPKTRLGEGCGEHQAWHPLDQDEKPEPAA